MTLPVGQGEQDEPIIRTPLHTSQMSSLELLAKDAITIHGTHYNGAILVDNADSRAIRGPTHAGHRGLFPVVGHLLVPGSLVQHPHHDHPVRVRGGQLLLGIVPSDHPHRLLVPIQRLVHGQIGDGGQATFILAIGRS